MVRGKLSLADLSLADLGQKKRLKAGLQHVGALSPPAFRRVSILTRTGAPDI